MRKLLNIISCLIILTITFLVPINDIYAYDIWVGYVTVSPSKTVHSTPAMGNFNAIEEIPPYISFRVVDSQTTDGILFYKIVYGDNKTGWITYHTVENSKKPTTTYGRPWTTPGKAIIGGAEYISAGYIKSGQYTSYLKKFQVNPGASVGLYQHQWMTNIRGPYFEAAKTYTGYSQYLDSREFIFSIPVYNNMPDSTTLSGMTNVGTTLTKEELNDETFEAELDKQGFPEDYKKYLRSLHKTYPKWTFKALKTNLDFETAVSEEIGKSCIETSTGHGTHDGCGNESASWAMADSESVRYFMDPRNFFDKQSIFMFEDLSYSDSVTETMVQRTLTGSFMAGISSKDNKTYAKLFLEAGQKHGVNPIYLASLSLQELGYSGKSIQASGATIEYYGIKYSSLYNYYNIGASGSFTACGGIVWASGGDPSTYSFLKDLDGNNTGGDEIVTPVNLDKYITDAGYKISGSYIYGISNNTSIDTVKNKITGVDVSISGNIGNLIGTGTTITLSKDGTTYSKVVIVSGDVDGDGKIAATDYVAIKNSIMEISSLSNVQKLGADMNSNNRVDAGDYVAIKNYIMNN